MLQQQWPILRAANATADTVELVVQINGKMRGKVRVPAAATSDEAAARVAVLAADVGQRWIGSEARIAKLFLVGNKNLVNIVLTKN